MPAVRVAVLILLLALAGCSRVAPAVSRPVGALSPLPAVTTRSPIRIWVDQIGYQTHARKIAIIAGDVPLPRSLALAVCDTAAGKTAWSLSQHSGALVPFHAGAKDPQSGDYVDQLDFSSFAAPGRYAIVLQTAGGSVRSYAFTIGDDPYKPVAEAMWKALYYQSADHDLPAKYGGAWHHGLDHEGPNQATQARVYRWDGGKWYEPVGTQIADPTPHDVSGGWWDAGDFNKYTGNTVLCVDDLLLGVELLGGSAKAAHLDIPPSAGGEDDLMAIVRNGAEFLIRDADSTGAAFGRVHEEATCPPEADTSPVQLTQTTSGATMSRAAALAFASVVWRNQKADPAFARQCLAESLKSWNLLLKHAAPWPADPNDPKKQAYTGDWFTTDYGKCRALAGACYFSITQDKAYDAIVHQEMAKFTSLSAQHDDDLYPAIWVYTHAKGADPKLAARMRQMVLAAGNQVAKLTGRATGYAVGLPGYWWGSNRLVGQSGMTCLLAAQFADSADARRRYLDAAGEYAHYLLGRNPIGLCYVTNLKSLGAEHSVMLMFHSWVGNAGSPYGQIYIGDGPGKVGPFPGMVVGGANGSMKTYVDSLDWHLSPWAYNEPDITYQSPCAVLVAYLGLKDGK